MLEQFKDLWPFLIFVGTGLMSFVLGKERNRWKIGAIGKEVQELSRRVSELEKQGASEAVTLAEIKIQLATLIKAITELRQDMKGKADK